jgi:hypothetical protein
LSVIAGPPALTAYTKDEPLGIPPELEDELEELDELLEDELLDELLVLPEEELLDEELLEDELLDELEEDVACGGFSPVQAVKKDVNTTDDTKPCQLMGPRPRITLLIKSVLMLQVSKFLWMDIYPQI